MSLSDLQAEAAAHRRKYRTHAFPIDLRRRMIEAMVKLRSDGVTNQQLSRMFHVDGATVRAWLRDRAPRLLPVVVDEASEAPATGPLTLVSPKGWRVEGVNIEMLTKLVADC